MFTPNINIFRYIQFSPMTPCLFGTITHAVGPLAWCMLQKAMQSKEKHATTKSTHAQAKPIFLHTFAGGPVKELSLSEARNEDIGCVHSYYKVSERRR